MASPYPRLSSAPLIMFRGVRCQSRDRLFASPLPVPLRLELSIRDAASFAFLVQMDLLIQVVVASQWMDGL
jgi:hypothetical protein